jgi:hypothetical protein
LSTRGILKLPYDQRRIIVVTDNFPAAAATRRYGWSEILGWVSPIIAPALTRMAVEAIIEARTKMRQGGEELVPVSWTDAKALQFPVGHPRKNVVYIGHPVDPPTYIPVADFHRFLFEHKVAEAQRLIRSLGALTVDVIRVEGWDQTAGVNLGLSTPASSGASIDVGLSAGREASTGRNILTTMKLKPTIPPHIPEGLVWFPHEPLWREVAEARLESGLDAFVIDVRSTDDYGVNAGLKALVAKTGLEVGGSFVEHRNTVWRLQGTFSPAPAN